MELKPHKKKKFKTITRSRVGLTVVQCSYCMEFFGLKTKFIESFSEANFHYACPYCHEPAGLEND